MDEPTDLSGLSNADLKVHIDQLTDEERDLSFRRRMVHGRLDLARNELIRRRKSQNPAELASVDLEELSRVLAGKLTDLSRLEGDEK